MRHLLFGLLCTLSVIHPVCGQEDAPSIDTDEATIREKIRAYQEAYNAREASSLAKLFTQNAELATGNQVLRGRDAILKDFQEQFASGKEVPTLELTEVTVDVISPGVAIETGMAVVSQNQTSQSVAYRAVHVKTEDGWLVDRVQDETPIEQPPSNYEHLKELEWMVGTWSLSADNTSTTISCRWTSNRNFLVQSYRVSGDSGIEIEGTQVIGWDPSRNRIRSWLFDSDGGFGSGAWSGDGTTWRVQTLQIVPSGEEASSTNIYRQVDEQTLEFSSIGRSVGGKLMKNIAAAQFVRQ